MVFNKAIFIHFPFSKPFPPFWSIIFYLEIGLLFHFSWSSFFLSGLSWFQEISCQVASLLIMKGWKSHQKADQPFNPPPSTFRAIILRKKFPAPRAFMTFFFEVLRNFGRYFRKNRAYGSKVTQHYVIERQLKIWTFSGFVYKTYGKWLLVPKLHFEL